MPSTFLGLNTAYLGLTAANAALNTTANNIANVNTEGYSRQHTVQKANEAMRAFATYGCIGAGVEVLAVERYRDEFYDVKYWNNNAHLGEYEVKQYYMKQIEDYFMDDGDEETSVQKGFTTIFDDMYDALAELKKDSGTADTRRDFIGTAENLAEYFNTMAGNLQDIQEDLNAEIKANVDKINSIASKIVTLNKQINVVELSGTTANELRDERALLVDELSEIVSVDVEEQDVTDPNNPDRYTGATRFIVKIAGGQTLLDDSLYYTLDCVARDTDEKVNQSDVNGLYDIVWSNGNTFSLTNASMGGKLQGLIGLRDGNNGEYFHGTVSAADVKTIDGVSHGVVTIDVTAEYLKDINKCTLSDTGGQITIGSRVLYYDSWTMNYDADADSCSYTFILSDASKNENTSVSGLVRKDARVGSLIDYQGIPYYMEQMNEWVRCYANAFNDILTQEGAVDNYGNDAQFFFLADMATDAAQFTFADSYKTDADGNYSISSTSDSYYRLTALNFSVSDKIADDPDLLATHTGNADEESKYNVVDGLIDLKTSTDKMSFRGCSSDSFLQCILSDIALNADRANTFYDTYDSIAGSIETQRLSVSGVDEDEEGVSLVKYQNAYSLASRMIQTLAEVYDRLILETGV